MNLCKVLQTVGTVHRQVVREYAFKSDLKIKWLRPEKVPCTKPEKSGDLGKLPPVDGQQYVLNFRDSKELQSAEPIVQSLFQLENNRDIETYRHHRNQLVREVQRHTLDFGSMEAKLARMTVTIRRMQGQLDQFPRNTKLKVELKELIDKRKKFLKYLRRWDYPRFEWILEKLDLVYKPPPTKFHWITRKESLQKLTDLHCENIKKERLSEYRKQLEAQQIPFLEDAIKKMVFVRQEQIDLEIPITVTEEHINDMKKELEELKLKQAKSADETSNGNKE